MVRSESVVIGVIIALLSGLWAHYGPALLPASGVVYALEYVAVGVVALAAVYLFEVYG